MKLRDYQKTLFDKAQQSYHQGNKFPCVVLPCGGGKTAIMGAVADSANKKGTPVVLIAHRQELITSISMSLSRFGLSHRLICSEATASGIKLQQYKAFGMVYVDPTSSVIVASIQTLVKRMDKIQPRPKLLICDEFHHMIKGSNYSKVYEYFGNPYGLGLTATPVRLSGESLSASGGSGYADDLIEGPSMSWLMDQGFLSKYKIFASQTHIDLSQVKKKKSGEFNDKQVAEIMDKPSIVGDAVQTWLKHGKGMQTVAYCASVNHSMHTRDAFIQAGVRAEHLDGAMNSHDRKRIIDDFADGKIEVLCSISILGEGFDLASIAQKDVNIQCVVNLSPTNSLGWYIQKMSRALRGSGGRVALLLDHVGDTYRFGLVEQDREWTLDGEEKQKRNNEESAISVKTCTSCFAIMLSTHKECINCGFVFPIKERVIEEVAGELQELSESEKEAIVYQLQAEKKQKRREQGSCQTLQDFLDLARARGYKDGWARKMWAIRQQQKQVA